MSQVTLYSRMEFFGEIAALSTGLCWAVGSMFFAEGGRILGSYKINMIRLVLAALIYTIILLVTKGHVLPDGLMWEHIFWLGLSGFIGFVVGDGAGFKAMVMIGPRLAMLLHALSPVMAVLIAWGFLDEQLGLLDLFGIAITISGISWVVSSRKYKKAAVADDHPDSGSKKQGVFYGIIFGLGQAIGLIFSKHAMINLAAPIEPMEASFIRILTAMIIIWVYAFVRGNAVETIKSFKNKKGMLYAIGGALIGPFLGVWMSLVAVKYIAAGIASTLNSTTPIWMLPIVRNFYNEKMTARIIIGTVVAVAGVGLLMVR